MKESNQSKPPAFSFYAQDFLTGVIYLTNEETGMYIKMLSKQWTDGKIPKSRLNFLIGREWENLSDELKAKFSDKGDFVYNERLEKEREKKENFLKKQRENGAKGGRPKKPKQNPTVNPNHNPNHNPNESQKKPLEKENEIEIEIEIENEIKDEDEIKMPWEEKDFLNIWKHWKEYKNKEYKFKYKSVQSEQAALTKLANLSNGNKEVAIEIVKESMANGWKGFFELDKNKNKNGRTYYERITEAGIDTTGI